MFKLNKTYFITTIIFTLLFALATTANAKTDASVAIAAKALSAKLKTDLSVEIVNVKFAQVQKYNVSKTEVGLKGSGVANDLPINFNVKVNTAKAVSTDVEYSFVEALDPSAELAEANTEDNLTRNLLVKINQDYKTENVVVAIDSFDTATESGKKVYTGSGEMRVGFDWSKINFSVTTNADGAVTGIKYEVQK